MDDRIRVIRYSTLVVRIDKYGRVLSMHADGTDPILLGSLKMETGEDNLTNYTLSISSDGLKLEMVDQ